MKQKKANNAVLFIIIALLLSTRVHSQITIMSTEAKSKYDNFVYDSLRNMSTGKYEDKYTYHHLIGQTLMYCGDPYSYRTRINFQEGNYYRVEGILPDDVGKGLYHRLSLINIDTGEKSEEGDIFTEKYNFRWVVLGHYEKMKSLYVNKDFMYLGNKGYVSYMKQQDNLIHLETDTVTKNIATGTVWTCVDIQVKPRKKGDRMDIDKRSPIVLIFDNPQYGKHYCYLEDESGKPYKNIYEEEMPLVCGKFQLKSYYDNVKALDIATKNRRKADLTRKYGASMANLILEGKIRIGMSKNMCRDSWGEPDDINKTITTYGTTEQWVYGYSYVYFDEKGQITAIQN